VDLNASYEFEEPINNSSCKTLNPIIKTATFSGDKYGVEN
jgi:hypothetical protein